MFKKKIAILCCLLSVFSFAEEIVDIEMMLFIERMKAAMKTMEAQKEKKRDVYFSNKVGYSAGKYLSHFNASLEVGAVNYQRNVFVAGELSGGYRNWGTGLNIGVLFKLGDIHLIVPGISSGFWFAMDDWYDYQFVLGGPFVKYLLGKNGRFLEASVRADMGWTEVEKRYYNDRWGEWDWRYENKFFINANFGVGLTFLF